MRRMRRCVAVAAVLVVAPVLGGCQKFQARVELKRGNVLYKSETYKGALEQFQKGLALDPGATFAWRSVGLSAMAMYRPGVDTPENREYATVAVEAFKKYLASFPDDEKVGEYLITTLISDKQYDEALTRLRLEADAHPDKAAINGVIVATLTKAGRLEEAYNWAKKRPDPQVLYSVAVASWDKSYNDAMIDQTTRAKFVEFGLDASDHALRLKPDYYEAMTYYNLLFREKAKLVQEVDPLEAQKWYAEAEKWRDKAIATRDAQAKKEAAAAAAVAKAGSST